MPDVSIISQEFEKELRRKNDVIRGLGMQEQGLQKNVDLLNAKIKQLKDDIESKNMELKSIDQALSDKRKLFDESCQKIISKMDEQQANLNEQKDNQYKRQSDQDYRESTLNAEKEYIQNEKKSLVESYNLFAKEIAEAAAQEEKRLLGA